MFEVVGRSELRAVKGRVERAIGFAIDIDVRTLVHVRVSLLSRCHFLLHGIFDEREVVVAIACYHSRQVFALRLIGELLWSIFSMMSPMVRGSDACEPAKLLIALVFILQLFRLLPSVLKEGA